jgi:hypothetical protein
MIWNILATITCIPIGILFYKQGDKFLAGVNLTLGVVNLVIVLYLLFIV